MFVVYEEPSSEKGGSQLESPVKVSDSDLQESEMKVSDLQEEVTALRLKQRCLDAKRREALNKILDIKGSIRVLCRVRGGEEQRKPCLNNNSPVSTSPVQIAVATAGGKNEFCVDKVFTQESTQEEVFVEVEPILRSALDGHNVCVLAYGQTGTGKTFTMEGNSKKPGIVPRAMKELFRQASRQDHPPPPPPSSFAFSISMLEVYKGNLRDLLSPKPHPTTLRSPPSSTPKSSLSIQSGSNGAVEVEGLTDIAFESFKHAYRCYVAGKRSRSTSWTNVNEASSRSHCLTRITIKCNGRVVSKVWMVDLGGSERLLKTGATGQTMDEGKAINLSLSALADVISALKRKRTHVPFRNSKLTHILTDSIGNDGSKVMMLIHVSPSEDDVGETICSLKFAARARASDFFNKEISQEWRKIKEHRAAELEEEMKRAEEEIEQVRNQIQMSERMILERKSIVIEGSPRSPLVVAMESIGDGSNSLPQSPTKINNRPLVVSSVPRFMASTACSRRRQSASSENVSKNSNRVKALRFGNRSSLDMMKSSNYSSTIRRKMFQD